MNRWERWVRQAHVDAENAWLNLLNRAEESSDQDLEERRFKALDARNTLVYVIGRLVAGDGVTPRTASPQPSFSKGVTQ